MYLCDEIVVAAASTQQKGGVLQHHPISQTPFFKIQARQFSTYAKELQNPETVRYILSDDVIGAACHMLLSNPVSMRDVVDELRLPYRSWWVEWTDKARVDVRRALGIAFDNDKEIPQRFGFLIRTDETGRAGVATFCWIHHLSTMRDGLVLPNICPLEIHFDFERIHDETIGPPPMAHIENSSMYKKWKDDPAATKALFELDRSAWVRPGVLGEEMALAYATTMRMMPGAFNDGVPRDVEAFMASSMSDLEGEFLNSLAVLMLLNARNGVETEAEDRTKINKARKKQGKTELLNHVIAHLRLNAIERRAMRDPSMTIAGGGKRAHMVRGHVCVRRSTKGTKQIWWRRPHVRGLASGPIVQKTVKVSL
jgi:hypothetical protein